MTENIHNLEKDIHHMFALSSNGLVSDDFKVICDKITGLSGTYDLSNSQHLHQVEKTIKELYKNLDNHGVTSELGLAVRTDEIDAGFKPQTVTGFHSSAVNPLTSLTGIKHGYSYKKINPNYTGHALRGFMGNTLDDHLTYDIRFDISGEISRDSIVDIVDFGDDTFSQSDFPNNTLGEVMDKNQSAIDAGDITGTARGRVLRWYDQFGNNNLIPTGRDKSSLGIQSGTLGPTFYTGSLLFDHIRIDNGEIQPRNVNQTMQTLLFENQSITLKCVSVTVASLTQGGGNEIQGLIGGFDATSNQPYIFLCGQRTAYQISADGAATDLTTAFQNNTELTNYQAGEDEQHYITEINIGQYYTFDFFYKPNDPFRNNFDGIGFNGVSKQTYVGNFKFKELLISEGLQISGQRNKLDLASKTRYAHY